MSSSTEVVAYDTNLFPTLLDPDPLEVSARFARRFAAAETVDDLFAVLEGNTVKGMVGRVVEIREVAWIPYESDRGIIPNAILVAGDVETGEALEFATTAEMCVLFVRRCELIGGLPVKVRITEKRTRSGRTAINFERP